MSSQDSLFCKLLQTQCLCRFPDFDENDGTHNSLAYRLNALETSFPAGCNTIMDAVTAKGQTPASNSPSDIATAIGNIQAEISATYSNIDLGFDTGYGDLPGMSGSLLSIYLKNGFEFLYYFRVGTGGYNTLQDVYLSIRKDKIVLNTVGYSRNISRNLINYWVDPDFDYYNIAPEGTVSAPFLSTKKEARVSMYVSYCGRNIIPNNAYGNYAGNSGATVPANNYIYTSHADNFKIKYSTTRSYSMATLSEPGVIFVVFYN